MSPPSTPSSSRLSSPQSKAVLSADGRVVPVPELNVGEQALAGGLYIQGQHQEASITIDQNRVDRGFIPSLPSTAQADSAHEARERELLKLRERERKEALRDRRDE